MAIEDQLTTFKSSLDSIKTALSNKGVSTSGNLTADQVSSKISSINTNQSTTKNMGSQSVTFKESTYTVTLQIAASYSGRSGHQSGFTLTSTFPNLYQNGQQKYMNPSKSEYAYTNDGTYSSDSKILSAYKTYLSSGKWPTFDKTPNSTYTFVTTGAKFTFNNVIPGSYEVKMQDVNHTMTTIMNVTVNSSNYSGSRGIYTAAT